MKPTVVAILGVVAIVAIVAMLVISGPGEPASGAESAVIFARSADSNSLDPQDTSSGEDHLVLNNIFETLVRFSDRGIDLAPGLAESWTQLDGGRVWEFDLRKNIFFHDGALFTADSVVFTFERLTRPPDASDPTLPQKRPYQSNFAMIDRVEPLSQYKVRFSLKAPSAIFLRNLAMFSAGIVSPEAVRRHGQDFGNHPVGTGPMRFVEWKKGDKIVLARNDRYWGDRSKPDRVIFIAVKDATGRVEKLRTGEAHIANNLALVDIRKIEEDKSLKLDFEVSMNVGYLGFNMRKAPYNDANFRQAVAHAIDRKKLIDSAYFGLAENAKSMVPPSILVPDSPVQYAHDPEKARAFLAKVQLPKEPVVLWVPVISRPYMPEPRKIAISIKDDLAKIGLEVTLVEHPWAAYLSMVEQDDHPMFLLGWSTDNGDPDNFYYALLHGKSIPDTNSTFFDHPEFNRLVEEAQGTVDPQERRRRYDEADRIFQKELPALPLVHVRQAVAMAKTVRYDMHPIDVRAFEIELK
jgi:peptide/nickel transport system substrate-binding protein